jgi:hypothetical protein
MFYGMTLCEKSRVLGLSTECKMVYEMARMLTEKQDKKSQLLGE